MLSFKPIFNLYIDITDYFSTKVKYRYIIQSNRYIILRGYIPDINCIVFKLISIIIISDLQKTIYCVTSKILY